MSSLTEPVTPPSTPSDSLGGMPGMIDLKDEESTPATSKDDDMSKFKKKLEKLAMMKEAGILSDEEFAEQKKMLLDEIRGEWECKTKKLAY